MTDGMNEDFAETMREKRDKYLETLVQQEREQQKKRVLQEQAETIRIGMDKDVKNMIREIRWEAVNELQRRIQAGNVSTRLLVELACHLPK